MGSRVAGRSVSWIEGRVSINALLAFGFGVVFIATMLAFAAFFPNPSSFQGRVFITTLALAAAGIGAMLPGFLEIRYKTLFRAGGAIAMAVGVYAYEPQITKSTATLIEPQTNPEPVSEAFLSLIDKGRIEDAWNAIDDSAKGVVVWNYDEFAALFRNGRQQLGPAEDRVLIGTNTMQSPPGVPVGLYRFQRYRAKFPVTGECREEVVALRAETPIMWAVFSYQISSAPVPC